MTCLSVRRVFAYLEVVMVTAQQIDLLTVTEAARAIGTTRGAIHHHRLTGRLPAITIDGRYLIPRESVVRVVPRPCGTTRTK